MGWDPREVDRTRGRLREAKGVIGTGATQANGRCAIDQEVGCVYAVHIFAERDGDFREVRDRRSGRRAFGGYGRGGAVDEVVVPGCARAVLIERQVGREAKVRDAMT